MKSPERRKKYKAGRLNSNILRLLYFFFCLKTVSTEAQLFTKLPSEPTQSWNSAVNWVDFDSDGDLDLSVSGDYPSQNTGQGYLYRNNSNIFTFYKNIRPIEDGDQVWSDFNNDNIPDLLYAGEATGLSAGIDTSDVSFDFHSKFTGFIPVANASIDWGDYDNDGDYDVIFSGKNADNTAVTDLYNNSKGIFTRVTAGLPGIADGKVSFIDYDLDCDLDIFITGQDINGNKYARLWKNNDGFFSVTNDIFLNVRWSQTDWADMNGDGYPDLILGGWDETNNRGNIFINNSGTGFFLSAYKVPKANRGSSLFGDIDNDGDMDLFVSGSKSTSVIQDNFIFYNNGTDSVVPDNYSHDALTNSNTQFADYDKDSDLDIVLNGFNSFSGNGNTMILNNSCSVVNSPPSVPANLAATVEGTSVILQWDNSTDTNTPAESITYNIYLGVSGNKIKVVTPIAVISGPSSGYRKIARQGYIRDNKWIIKNLPVGTYYWGVQALDNSLGASAFSSESGFEIKERFTKIESTEIPSTSSPATYFDSDHDGDIDIFLNYTSEMKIIDNPLNTPASFSSSNYRTLSATTYNPIRTISPNDYDNDNTIDFSISGDFEVNDERDSSLALYNYSSDFNYTMEDQALLKNLNFEYVIWADFNNDGKQDIVTSGKTTNLTTNKPSTLMYQNIGNGGFRKVSVSIRGFEKCGGVSGDFDNDLDIDLVIYGIDSTGNANTYLYVNEGEFVFTEILIPGNDLFRQYLQSGICTGDYNKDGFLDIFLSGVTNLNDKYNRVLLNQSLTFVDANLPVRSSTTMSNFMADYDHDGDLDLYSTSIYSSPDKMWIYQNNSGLLEEQTYDISAAHKLDLPFMAVDLDNKNGLDFLMKVSGGNYIQYFDNWGSNNRLSSAPGNIRYDQDQLDIILKWNKLPDCPACTYNIRIGTTPGGVDVMSPMADLTTGYRYVVQPGNAYLNNRWKISDLDVGTYYWSVQAVDPSNTGGPWSPESTFNVSHIDADFSFTTVCLGDSTSFTDLSVSTDQINKWKWEFGDGTTSNIRNPKHSYNSSGTFTAGLWAYSEAGDSAYQSHPVQVKAIADADFSSDIACQGNSTSLINNTNINGLTINSWLWNFGDGQFSVLRDPGTHGYLIPGDYQVKLTAFAANGCNSSKTRNVQVAEKPVAAVTANAPLTFCKGDSVTLSVPYNSAYTYSWKLGETTITGSNSNKLVAKFPGSYVAKVINPAGNCATESAPVLISVLDAPAAPLISVNDDVEFCQGDSVVLSAADVSGQAYSWRLNGGAIGPDRSTFSAKVAGVYSLLVTNQSGCYATATNKITVSVNSKPVMPVVNINGATNFCSGEIVTFRVPAIAGYTYSWNNEKGPIEGAVTNSYLATGSGSYFLEILNQSGCVTKTPAVKVNVKESPLIPILDASNYIKGACPGEEPVRLTTRQTNGEYKYLWYKDGQPLQNDTLSYLDIFESGNYILSARLNGCLAQSAMTEIEFPQGPDKPILHAQGPTLWYLACDNTSANKYMWYYNGKLIEGADKYYYVANYKLGQYQVSIANKDGCYTRSDVITIPPGYTGVDDADPFNTLIVYPNPAKGRITIEMNNNILGDILIDVFSQSGKKLMSTGFDKNTLFFKASVDLTGQPQGLYIINLSLKRYHAVKKIMIE